MFERTLRTIAPALAVLYVVAFTDLAPHSGGSLAQARWAWDLFLFREWWPLVLVVKLVVAVGSWNASPRLAPGLVTEEPARPAPPARRTDRRRILSVPAEM